MKLTGGCREHSRKTDLSVASQSSYHLGGRGRRLATSEVSRALKVLDHLGLQSDLDFNHQAKQQEHTCWLAQLVVSASHGNTTVTRHCGMDLGGEHRKTGSSRSLLASRQL